MSADKLSRDDDPTASYPTVAGNAPAAPINTAGSSERCGNCHAPLAADQRYCISCGERRGRARFAPSAFSGAAGTESAVAPPAEPRRPRTASGTILVAFVATLLVAVGLGVLIGHDSSSHGTASAGRPTYKINVYGGGSGAATAGTAGSSSSSNSGSSTKSGKTGGKAVKSKPVSKAAAQKVAAKGAVAASKTLGTSKSNLPPATVKQGGACAKGAGCHGGKFTGNFFGGG
jgi:hypothetical protein